MYYQYEVTFALYVMTPAEKLITNTIVLGLIILLAFGVFALIPRVVIKFAVHILLPCKYGGGEQPQRLAMNSTTCKWILAEPGFVH